MSAHADKTLHRKIYNINDKGVCLYFKDSLAIKQRKDLQILDECIISELTLRRKKVFFVVVYRSPSQNAESFYSFLENLELIIQNLKDKRLHCIILTGDFNRRSNSWWVEDEGTTEGTKLSELCDSCCLNQLIEEPTNILGNSLCCIDLLIQVYIQPCMLRVIIK